MAKLRAGSPRPADASPRSAITFHVVARARVSALLTVLGAGLWAGLWVGLWVVIATTAGGGLSCAPVVEPEVPEADLSTTDRPLSFDYVALDGTRVTGESTRGRITVVVFITTYDLRSQVILRELAELMHTKTPRFNSLGVVLEPPKNAPLVDAFATTMELPFRLALSPSPEAFDEGEFGKVDAVPTVVILDQRGRQRFRRAGHMSTEELDAAISQANR